MQSSLTQSNAVRVKPFTSTLASRPSRRPTVTRASAQKSDRQPSDVVMMSVGALAAAQMALLPGVVMAAERPPPIKAATDVGEAVQGQVPDGAGNPKTREERNSSRDEKIGNKLNTIKDRFDADKVAEGANTGDIFYGNSKNKGVSYSLTAPALSGSTNLQFNVSEKLNQAAGDIAADAGQIVKSATTSDPLDAAKNAASDVTDAAKKTTNKLPGQGIDTKPVSFSGSLLQVNISEKLNKAAGDAAADAGQTVKSAATSNPLDAAKNTASDVTDAAKKAANKLPGRGIDTKLVSFSESSLQANVVDQVNVDVNPVEQTKAAAQEAAASVKSQTGGNPLDALKNKIDEASVTDNSPQVQLDKAGDKAQQLKQQATSSLFGGPLLHNVSFTPSTNSLLLADMGNASLAEPQGNEGGVTQENREAFASGKGNAVQGGDLKDSVGNENAAQNKTSDLGKTAAQQDAAPRNGPKKTSGLPSVLGGDSLVRDDSETPEQVAKGNLAKAKQADGNAIDSLKSKLGL